jgi:molecular chaperone DnaK
MAADNKTIGRFELTGIPPAMKGIPQIEVTFEIDQNGIVSVTALDKGTNKSANVTITASSNLSKDDIDKAVKDAERYAEEDKKRKELVEMKNTAEQLIFAVEKTITESGDKLSEEDKNTLKTAAENAKKELEGADTIEKVKSITEELSKTTNPIFTKLYQTAQQSQEGEASSAADNNEDNPTINVDPEDIS